MLLDGRGIAVLYTSAEGDADQLLCKWLIAAGRWEDILVIGKISTKSRRERTIASLRSCEQKDQAELIVIDKCWSILLIVAKKVMWGSGMKREKKC